MFIFCKDLILKPIHEFLSWRISNGDKKCSTDNVMAEHHYSFYVVAHVAACQIRNVLLTGLFVMPNWDELYINE